MGRPRKLTDEERKERKAESLRRFREARPEYDKEWAKANPDRIKAARSRWYKKNPEKVKEKQRLARFARHDLTEQEYNEMVCKQDNRCKLCGVKYDKLVIDHNHETGKVRGLLCYACNSGLGLLQDDANLLRKAADYVEKDGT